MLNNPIKLQDNLTLYSGDIITLNNSKPLLVEVIDEQTVKLRNINSSKYLYKSRNLFKKSLRFSSDPNKFSNFTVKERNGDQVILQTNNNEYLAFDSDKFSLSDKEKWLTITKQQNVNVKDIAEYEERLVQIIDKEKPKRGSEEEEIIAHHFYDNKSNTSSKQNFKFSETRQEEHNITCSAGFTWGASANFKAELCPALGIEIGGQFERTNETANSFTKIKTKTFEKSIDIDCEPQKKTTVKLMAKKVKLITPYTAIVKRTIGNNNYEYLIDGEYLQNNYTSEKVLHQAVDTRNILLVGWTGSGKSTLANVLSNSEDFTESNQSTSETKFFQKSEEFEWQGNYYCVIDNIGFGDSNEIKEDAVLFRIGEAINSAHQGLSHVLLVFDGKFSDKVKEDFDKLGALKITNSLITVVRSRFENFGNGERCRKDIELLEKESIKIKNVLNNCRGLLHVNNGDERSRNKSRKKVLDHLDKYCNNSPFKPKEWEDIASLIEKYFEERAKLVNEIRENADKKTEIIEKIDNLKTDAANQVKEKIQGEEINEFVQLAQIIQKEK